MKLYGELMIVALIALACANYNKEAEQIVYPDELPADPFTAAFVEKLRVDLQDYQGGMPLSEEATSALDKLEDLGEVKRKKRQSDAEAINNITPWNSAYCCKQQAQTVKIYRTKIAMRTKSATIPAGGSIKCGTWGWSRCASDARVSIVVQEYYTDQYNVPDLVPASEWVNGCPTDQITCCPTHKMFKEQCFTFVEIGEIFELQRLFPEFDFTLSLLGVPYNPRARITETKVNRE